MAYPTTINFQLSTTRIGFSGVAGTPSATQSGPLGAVTVATDSVYGYGTFIYLAGAASTAAGSIVSYDAKAGTTTLAVAATRGPLAVAMSASVAGTFGWYQIEGAGVVSTTAAGTGAANALLAVTATAGQATVSGGAGVKIDGIVCKTTQDAPGTGFTGVQLTYPSANGNT